MSGRFPPVERIKVALPEPVPLTYIGTETLREAIGSWRCRIPNVAGWSRVLPERPLATMVREQPNYPSFGRNLVHQPIVRCHNSLRSCAGSVRRDPAGFTGRLSWEARLPSQSGADLDFRYEIQVDESFNATRGRTYCHRYVVDYCESGYLTPFIGPRTCRGLLGHSHSQLPSLCLRGVSACQETPA